MQKQLTLVQILAGWVITVIGGAISLGVMYGGIRKDIDHASDQANDVKQALIELKQTAQELRERMVRIETKLDDRK